MKLVRFGDRGAERPGAVDQDGEVRDLSGVVGDIDASAISPAGLDRLRGVGLSGLPRVPKGTRLEPHPSGLPRRVLSGVGGRRRLPMPSPLSVDLRERVVAFVSEGASCREAASRFGVSAAGAGRRAARLRQEGHVAPKPSGGDHASHHVETHAGPIPATCRRRPTTLPREVRDRLAERGVRTGTSGLSRFFARHGIGRKKGRRLPPSGTGRT